MDKVKQWLLNEDDDDDYEPKTNNHNAKAAPRRSGIIDIKVIYIDKVDKMSIVGDAMKDGKIVVCKIKNEILVRALDFISGVQYALGYEEQNITKNDYIFIPPNVVLDIDDYKIVEND